LTADEEETKERATATAYMEAVPLAAGLWSSPAASSN